MTYPQYPQSETAKITDRDCGFFVYIRGNKEGPIEDGRIPYCTTSTILRRRILMCESQMLDPRSRKDCASHILYPRSYYQFFDLGEVPKLAEGAPLERE